MFRMARTQNSSWYASNCEKRLSDPPQTQTCSLQRQQYLDSNQHRVLFPFLTQRVYLLSHSFRPSRKSAVSKAHVELNRGSRQCWAKQSQGWSQWPGCYGATSPATPQHKICFWVALFMDITHKAFSHLSEKLPLCLKDGEIRVSKMVKWEQSTKLQSQNEIYNSQEAEDIPCAIPMVISMCDTSQNNWLWRTEFLQFSDTVINV